MNNHPDILIVGGGVIGLTTAYFLAREDVRVTVVDKADIGLEASWAGAGILPPGNPDQAKSPFDRLRAESVAAFPGLSEELRERTGIDNGYLRSGGLEFLSESDLAAAEEWRGCGVHADLLDEAALQELEPTLSPGLGRAHHLPDMAQVRNPRHLNALSQACRGLGVNLSPGCPVFDFECKGDHILSARTSQGSIHAGRFLLTAGAWTNILLEMVGWSPGIKPVRGQILLLETQQTSLRKILLWGPKYIVPRRDGRILVGSTEEDVGFVKRTTAQGIADLLDLATTLVPMLGDAQVKQTWAGLRPGSPDDLPILGQIPNLHNLFVAAGHFRAGIQLSPGTARLMKELLLGETPSLPMDDFSLERFSQAGTREQQRVQG
ncbi:MAG: glycine oxidase ThiO [Gemmataceae bacterium]